ncbi:tRNA 2-thiouridine(34) synthase MnmA [Desulfatiferula olefinivorans]
MSTRVAVAVSGGIDSLFSAHLLIREGYRVTGIHFVTGYGALARPDEARAAMARIADQLDIPIHVIDLSDTFEQHVVNYFVDEYRKGRTPNPCLRCNPRIKFGVLLEAAGNLGIGRIATGHYVRTRTDADQTVHLHRGLDPAKDQAYFLAFLNQEQLKRALFPLGETSKDDIRREAEAMGLAPVSAKESQDICFITGDYKEFLSSRPGFAASPGPIVTVDGKTIGRHQGLSGFTIGQRRGINCPAAYPYYVTGLDTESCTLIVGPKEALFRDHCRVTDVTFIGRTPSFPADLTVRIRYAHPGTAATLTADGPSAVIVRFHEPVMSVTPGQGAVFYDGDEVLGGGWIA